MFPLVVGVSLLAAALRTCTNAVRITASHNTSANRVCLKQLKIKSLLPADRNWANSLLAVGSAEAFDLSRSVSHRASGAERSPHR